MQPYEFIEGHEEVLARFGRWPSFHDGEVHRIVLDRMSRSPSGSYFPSIELYLRGWIAGPQVTAEGRYSLKSDSIVHLRFEDIYNLELEGFNQQNVLSSLNLSLIEDPDGIRQGLHVELEHCYLFSCEFSARKAKVCRVVPYVETSDG